MDLPELPPIDKFKPVPSEFHSFELDGVFENCCMCDTYLLEDGVQYIIEKAFSNKETVFEYAMCFKCREKFNEELSSQSLKLIEHYFDERIDFAARRQKLMQLPGVDHQAWVNTCLLSGKTIQPESEYQIYAQCDGPDLLFTYMPYAISGEEIESLSKSISKETRERLDDFIDDVLGVPGAHLDISLLV